MGSRQETQGISKVDAEENFSKTREGVRFLEKTRMPLCRADWWTRVAPQPTLQERVVCRNDTNRRLYNTTKKKRATIGVSDDPPFSALKKQGQGSQERLDPRLSLVFSSSIDTQGTSKDLQISLIQMGPQRTGNILFGRHKDILYVC